ncbi:MAG: hypothetical protein J7F05_00940 [Trichodesmium erythraeum GBRTRLIN201]|nr:hypothetical protein [Trichodesmium erythraeum GBRTRLIN201]
MSGILKFVIGDRWTVTFTILWQMIQDWACFLYITYGYNVYPYLIENCERKVSKTAMT